MKHNGRPAHVVSVRFLRVPLVGLVLLMLVQAAQAGGAADTDTQCSDPAVGIVCATAALDVDLTCALDGTLVTCTWSGNWSASFWSTPALPGRAEAPAWGTFTACGELLCVSVNVDYYDSCAWNDDAGCGFTHPFSHDQAWTLAPGECLDASIEMGVPAHAAVPAGLPVVQADAFATAADDAYVCLEA